MKKNQRFIVAAMMSVSLLWRICPGTHSTAVKLNGWVIDSACAYTKGLDKPIGVACAKACAKNGSPLVILTDDGTIYVPIDSATPSASQNPKLLCPSRESVSP